MYRSTRRSGGDLLMQWVIYAGIALLYFFVVNVGGCSVSESRFKNAIRSNGMNEGIQGPYDWFECGTGDVWNNSFVAWRPMQDGVKRRVKGTVCCGILKGCTVRVQ